MINLIKNEFIKLFSSKKLPALMLITVIVQLVPIAFTFRDAIFTGQTYPTVMLGVLVSWLLPIFLIIVVAEIITDDYTSGMLSHTLIHPVSRPRLLASKILFLLLLIILILFASMLSAYLIGTIFFGWGEDFTIRGVAYSTAGGFAITAASHLVSAIPLLAFSSVVMLLGLLFHTSALVVGTAAGILFAFYILGEMLSDLEPFLLTTYFSYFSHFYFYLDDAGSLLSALGVMLVYTLVPYIIGHIIFLRRDLCH